MGHSNPRTIDKYSFFSGFMLALGAQREKFVAEGQAFHEAFSKTIEYARQEFPEVEIEGAAWFRIDPVFGVVREAHEMLLEAEEDRLISLLNPALRKAQFRITKEQAMEELQEMESSGWFLQLAKYFDDQLPPSD